MTVWVVILYKDGGIVAGVFSSQQKAADYTANNPYNGYAIYERVIDTPE